MLKWSVKSPSDAQFKIINDETINGLMPQLKLDLRLREVHRGGALRLDQALSRQKTTEGLLTEAQTQSLNEASAIIVEGIFKDAWEKAKEMGGKAYDKIKEVINKLKEYAMDLLTRLYNYLVKLTKQGFDYLLQFLGISFEEGTGTKIVI